MPERYLAVVSGQSVGVLEKDCLVVYWYRGKLRIAVELRIAVCGSCRE